MTYAERLEVIRKWLPTLVVIGSIGSVGYIQAIGDGFWYWFQDRIGVTELNRLATQNEKDIRRLQLPIDIFEVSPLSRPTEGFCVATEPCSINVRVRRVESAMACRIVPGSVNYFYRNPRNNEVYDAEVLSGRPRDVGTRYINLGFTFSTPGDLIPNAELCVRPKYVNCPGMSESSGPIDPDEECFELDVLTDAQAATRRGN